MRFLGALPEGERGEAALIGIPFDATSIYRSGSRYGPAAIREASHSLETFSPFLDRDLLSRDYIDWGEMEFPPGRADLMVEKVEERVLQALDSDLKPVLIGGEHTATLGAVKALLKGYPDLVVIQLDAHLDFKEDCLGEKICHSTLMRRISEIVPAENIFRLGIRSGTRDDLVDAGIELPMDYSGGENAIERLARTIPKKLPLYVTLDLDVFDPSLVPGVGNPEPNGLTFREFIQITRSFSFTNFVGFDVMELTPQYDQTGVSAVVAASVVRDLLLCMLQ